MTQIDSYTHKSLSSVADSKGWCKRHIFR